MKINSQEVQITLWIFQKGRQKCTFPDLGLYIPKAVISVSIHVLMWREPNGDNKMETNSPRGTDYSWISQNGRRKFIPFQNAAIYVSLTLGLVRLRFGMHTYAKYTTLTIGLARAWICHMAMEDP